MQIDELINSFMYNDTVIDIRSKRSIYYEKVFQNNNVTRKEFYQSYAYYQQHPGLLKALFDSLKSVNERRRGEIFKEIEKPTVK